LLRDKRAAGDHSLRKSYADPQQTREREALLKRIRELNAEIAQHDGLLRSAGTDEA
jgi:hypothetical protein